MRRADELAIAVGHIRDGEQRVLRQEVLVSKLAAAGYPRTQATELLATFQITLDLMKQHLDLIEREIEAEKIPKLLARVARCGPHEIGFDGKLDTAARRFDRRR